MRVALFGQLVAVLSARSLPPEFRLSIPPQSRTHDPDDITSGDRRHDRLRRSACPCSEPALCNVIQHHPEKEVFGFGADNNSWRKFPFDLVTSVAWPPMPVSLSPAIHEGDHDKNAPVHEDDNNILCAAHRHGTRLIAGAPDVSAYLTADVGTRKKYVDALVDLVRGHYVDGVTFDYESPDSAETGWKARKWYGVLVGEARDALKAVNPGYQVLFG